MNPGRKNLFPALVVLACLALGLALFIRITSQYLICTMTTSPIVPITFHFPTSAYIIVPSQVYYPVGQPSPCLRKNYI